MKRYILNFLLLIFVIVSLSACSLNGPKGKETENTGNFTKEDSTIQTVDYENSNKGGFWLSLDFTLTSGKVRWEILNPQDKVQFEGYATMENGRLYRQLTYPDKYLNGALSRKESVEPSMFGNLTFDSPSITGKYKLKLYPEQADGTFKVKWYGQLSRK